MRIFIFILSLIFSVAFVLLNVLGFNGVLTLNEFFLVNVLAEVLVCLLLGHFMFRTYANHKKLKKLQQEMTTRQASTVAQEQTAKKKHGLKLKKKADPSPAEAPAPQQPAAPQRPAQPDPRRAPMREQVPTTQPPQEVPANDATQPRQPIRTEAPNMDSTTLYNSPFGK